MFQPPSHQVGGHTAVSGQLGPVIDTSGHFYKPLQSNSRGSNELAFYTALSSSLPARVLPFFPVFHGTRILPASDGSGPHPHLVLDDLVAGLHAPSVVDLKIGARTWYPGAGAEYVERCFEKDRATTTARLGFRVSGLQVYDKEGSSLWKPSKKVVLGFTVDDVRLVLRRFVSSAPSATEPDCVFASAIYGGSRGVLSQLMDLKEWFEDQTTFHFNSVSVLMFRGNAGDGAKVKLVDFAHVVEGEGVIDHNFLGGLCSLIKFVSEILSGSNSCTTNDSEPHESVTIT